LAFECRTLQVIRTGVGRPSAGNVVIGEVVCVYADDGLVNERMHVDADRLAAFGRMGGHEYCLTRDRFQMPMGRAALELSDVPPRRSRAHDKGPPTREGPDRTG
jgi:hypothetical protein